ncbi:MAG: hypothetical protein JOY66_00325 [Acetobacteraceae bacterium]|nr:hypothetical protein [Acetobacteraceae bacterium]
MTRFSERLHARLIGRRQTRAQGRLTARDWGATADIILVQTCDPFAYFDLLAASSRANRAFCARHGIAYAGFVGIKRGFHPWHAAFNRIALLREYVEQGFAGWVLYLDADALVVDLDWDARAYLRARADFAAVLAPAGEGVPDWEVNDGVAFFNLGHPSCRALIAAWNGAFARVGDDALRAAGRWDMMPNDQDLLQRILRGDAGLRQAIFLESPGAINSREASLVRQVLRAQEPDMPSRRRAIEAEADAALLRAGVSPAAPE